MFTAGPCFLLRITPISVGTRTDRDRPEPMAYRSDIRIRLLYLGGIDLWPEGYTFRESDPRAWGIEQAIIFRLLALTLEFRCPLDDFAGRRSIRG